MPLNHAPFLFDVAGEIALLLPLPALVIANLAVSRRWAQIANLVLLSAGVGFLVLNTMAGAFVRRPGATPRGLLVAAAIQLVAAGLAVVCLRRGPRAVLARVLPLDPDSPVTTFALVGAVVLLGLQASYEVSTDALSQIAAGPSLDRLDLVAQELPLLAAALLGVGLITRRSTWQALDRLGLLRPAWWHLVLALAVAIAYYFISSGADRLQQLADPALARRIDQATSHYYRQLGDPIGIATIALAAGIAEEIFFRGALQPRLGIILTSILFTSLHTQYGLSIDTAVIFVLSCGLGLLRRFTNTTTSVLAHVGYNALVGVGLAGGWVLYAVGLEAGLVLLAGLGWYLARQSQKVIPNS